MSLEHTTPVLIVGGGPAGLILAFQLARHGVRCTLIERNVDTTEYPKMTFHNPRTMELLKRLGIDEGIRAVGVEPHNNFHSVFHSGFSKPGRPLGRWNYESVDYWTKKIAECNDGTLPREPYQRCAQSDFEKWLKPAIIQERLIDSRWGVKFESLVENEDRVISACTTASGQKLFITSQYVVGCDGAGSRVRRSIGATLNGGPISNKYYLVNFVSHDLDRLRPNGQHWHVFFTSGSTLVAQNEEDRWTAHFAIPLDTDIDNLDPLQSIYDALGGSTGIPYPVKVDKILLTSSWRPGIAIVDKYRSAGGRIFLSGDSAHQNIPTGGYGYNTAVGDSTDLGWKLTAVLNGYGGKVLLDSYEIERRPVGVRNLEWSGVHAETHATYARMCRDAPQGLIVADTPEGEELRQRITNHINMENIENGCHGVELGYRYNDSPIILQDKEIQEPHWNPVEYIPSTWPGGRPPHVWLDGKSGITSIFDLFGNAFSLVDFTADGKFLKAFDADIQKAQMPVKKIHLPNENHVRSVWERDAVLVRPDDIVAWRASVSGDVPVNIGQILAIAVGKETSIDLKTARNLQEQKTSHVQKEGFKSVVNNADLYQVESQAPWQKNV